MAVAARVVWLLLLSTPAIGSVCPSSDPEIDLCTGECPDDPDVDLCTGECQGDPDLDLCSGECPDDPDVDLCSGECPGDPELDLCSGECPGDPDLDLCTGECPAEADLDLCSGACPADPEDDLCQGGCPEDPELDLCSSSVRVRVAVDNVDWNQLSSDPAALRRFESACRTAFATSAGVPEQLVYIRLSPGSVGVDADITPSAGGSILSLQAVMASNTETLRSSLLSKLQSADLGTAVVGVMSVSPPRFSLSEPAGPQTPMPSPAPSPMPPPTPTQSPTPPLPMPAPQPAPLPVPQPSVDDEEPVGGAKAIGGFAVVIALGRLLVDVC